MYTIKDEIIKFLINERAILKSEDVKELTHPQLIHLYLKFAQSL